VSAIKKSFKYGDHTVTLETGELARQADGAVLVTMNETVVLVTTVGLKKATPGRDFFPLTVNYIEKTYAAGRIPGGFFKREGRPTEKETLTSRLIDRPIRPLFPEGFINDVQVVAQVISVNSEMDPDIASLLGASAALAISGMPFLGPIGGARVGYIDGKYILNPTTTQLATSQLDLVVAGTAEGVLMVESEADGLNEDVMLGAVTFGHEQMQIAIKAINELTAEAGKPKWTWVAPEPNKELQSAVSAYAESAVAAAYTLTEKMERYAKIKEIKAAAVEALSKGDTPKFTGEQVGAEFSNLEYRLVRGKILDGQPRIDGRDTKTVRAINIRTGVLARTHGSALFTRGETQALVVTTLGTGRDAQIIDGLMGEERTVHAALQFSSLQRRRDRHDGIAEASRNRPRQPGEARRESSHARRRQVSICHSCRVRNSRVQRLELHGFGVRHQPRADGRRCADQGAGRGRCNGVGQGRRSL